MLICGGNHKASSCPCKDKECYLCRKKGHPAKVCGSKTKLHHSPGNRYVSGWTMIILLYGIGSWYKMDSQHKKGWMIWTVTHYSKRATSDDNIEWAIQTFKEGMKQLSSGSLNTKVNRFLLKNRIIPHMSTGSSPLELMWVTNFWSHLDLLLPNPSHKVKHAQK